jgi:UDP-N-acetylmuramate dehydrogenase
MHISRVSLKDYTSLHIGGEADMVLVDSDETLVEACVYADTHKLRIHVLGGGTNTVFKETISDLLVLKMEMKKIAIEENGNDVLLTVGAGERWDDIVQYTVDKGWWGLENLSHVPGNVGAAPIQNIGAYGAELKDVFVSLRAYDFTERNFVTLMNVDCEFGYRDSLFKRNPGRYIITEITVKLSKTPNPRLTYKPLDTLVGKQNLTLADIRALVIETRAKKLPDYKKYPNAGSFFKNPIVARAKAFAIRGKFGEIPIHEVAGGYKIPSAWLIEHLTQLKGVRKGNVGTWPAQPLVIVNYGEADFEELDAFANLIKDTVAEASGVLLEREVNFIG